MESLTPSEHGPKHQRPRGVTDATLLERFARGMRRGMLSQRNITDDAEDTHTASKDDGTDSESWKHFSISKRKSRFAKVVRRPGYEAEAARGA